MSVLALTALVFTLLPQAVFAGSLAAPTNLDIEGYYSTNDTTPTFTWDKVSGATWYEYRLNSMSWVGIGNVSSYTFTTVLADGWHTFYLRAHNSSSTSSTVSYGFEIDTTGPSVSEVSPSYTYEDQVTTFAVAVSGESEPVYCAVYVDGTHVANMEESGSNFVASYTFSSSGTYTVYAKCKDGDGNWTIGNSRTITVYAQSGDPDDDFTVPGVSLTSSIEEDEEVTFTVEPYGDLDADSCYLYIEDDYVGVMSEDDGEFSREYTFSDSGTYEVYAYCQDEDGDWTWGESTWVTVEDSSDSDEYPEVPAVSPSSATEDEETTITVEPEEDENGEEILWCDLYVNNANVGDMDEDDGEFSLDYTFTNDGSYTVYATCTDEDYDTTRGTSRTITVEEADEDDDFTVPAVSPSSADEDEEVEFTVEPYGDLDAESCKLYVDGDYVGTMSEDDGEFSREYTFTQDGEYTVYAYCEDENGDWHKGTSREVDVDDEDSPEAEEGSLIKLSCGASSTASDPCRAVYYYGEDGERHAFPNESTFYSWYEDFDDVIEVSSSFMSSIALGENVTYRPGSVVVKFESSSAVYAIEAERTLRHYETWSLLESDYGDDAAELIMVLPDSLYSSYDLGDEIDSSGDFDRTDAYYSVDGIEDLF